eukprot:CAMPEP_0172715706 /NCGR_PEP_ID=MMETSP1074-20121228/67700_1 /TAXON_ID=2916 /ORGANISM="Ceratium fusus, Strain PA161109" /LENGTH=280 /DNA_ID=CAMNT_0013540311 /DNA_START=34 /DNA_END=876 /DNA_ORIENTATION=-
MAVHHWIRWRTQYPRDSKLRRLQGKSGRANQFTTRAQKAVAIMLKSKRGISRAGPTLACKSVQDWLLPRCNGYHGMHVSRTPTWGDVQHHVDALASYGLLGLEETAHEDVQVAGNEDQSVEANLSNSAQRLVAPLLQLGMPDKFIQQIQADFQEVGGIVAKMMPTAEKLILKLEIMGEGICSRWHRDNYAARAIITYNGRGTEMLRHDDVDFWELDNCGNNLHIVRDGAQIFSVGAGDVLFMKGLTFPGNVNGLVHKSPDKRYHRDGNLMNRLVLKVDVP